MSTKKRRHPEAIQAVSKSYVSKIHPNEKRIQTLSKRHPKISKRYPKCIQKISKRYPKDIQTVYIPKVSKSYPKSIQTKNISKRYPKHIKKSQDDRNNIQATHVSKITHMICLSKYHISTQHTQAHSTHTSAFADTPQGSDEATPHTCCLLYTSPSPRD